MDVPHYCRDCGSQLCKTPVYDVKRKCSMGHYWLCMKCVQRFAGFDEPGEYNGEPGGAKESNADFTGPTTGPAPETGVAGSGANPC